MTPFYLQTETEADMWAALTEMGYVAEHEGEQYPQCVLHEIRHVFEGDWHAGRETTEDC